ncbi:MAG TPA: hypothetical protein VMF62_19015 [Acetobacteraceae bacterium]|nr:hypothetical protein [Acetobacteraceae bacterium]
MNIKTSVGLVAAGLIGLGVVAASPAMAAPEPGFVGNTASSVAGCPFISWRLANNNGQIRGWAEYSDLSGVSYVTGTMDSSGHFTLTLTKTAIGDGPVGTVTGMRSANGRIVATLTGQGCANNSIDIPPVRDMNNMNLVNRTGSGGSGAR